MNVERWIKFPYYCFIGKVFVYSFIRSSLWYHFLYFSTCSYKICTFIWKKFLRAFQFELQIFSMKPENFQEERNRGIGLLTIRIAINLSQSSSSPSIWTKFHLFFFAFMSVRWMLTKLVYNYFKISSAWNVVLTAYIILRQVEL